MFEYKARSAAGKLIKSKIEANSMDEVRQALKERGLTVIEVTPPRTGLQGDISIPFLEKGPGLKGVAVFSKQLATLINAGVPLVQSVAILQKQQENKKMAEALKKVRNDLEGGMPLSEALRAHPKIFDRLFVNLVRAGESSGTLDQVLERVASFQEKELETRGRIKSAMTYPVVVLVIAIGITWFLLSTVVPQFAGILKELGAPLPFITKMLIGISGFLQNYTLVIVGLAVAAFFGFRAFGNTKQGRYMIDSMILKMPVIGNLQKKNAISTFSRTFGLLMNSGVNIIESLEITRSTAGNVVIEETIDQAREVVMVGQQMSSSFATSPLFPPMVVSMIAIGEETGGIDAMLGKVADFYDREVEEAVEGLVAAIEPLLIIFLGTIVGTIVAGMFLPMFSIMGSIG